MRRKKRSTTETTHRLCSYRYQYRPNKMKETRERYHLLFSLVWRRGCDHHTLDPYLLAKNSKSFIANCSLASTHMIHRINQKKNLPKKSRKWTHRSRNQELEKVHTDLYNPTARERLRPIGCGGPIELYSTLGFSSPPFSENGMSRGEEGEFIALAEETREMGGQSETRKGFPAAKSLLLHQKTILWAQFMRRPHLKDWEMRPSIFGPNGPGYFINTHTTLSSFF